MIIPIGSGRRQRSTQGELVVGISNCKEGSRPRSIAVGLASAVSTEFGHNRRGVKVKLFIEVTRYGSLYSCRGPEVVVHFSQAI